MYQKARKTKERTLYNSSRWKSCKFMTIRFVTEKYVDPEILVVTTYINGNPIKNTLVYLSATINVMTMETLS